MKPQKPVHSSKVDVGLDRLSEMPDQVLVHILSFMPNRDAVRTMLLRRFGNLWTMLPALDFDFNHHYVRNYHVDVNDVDAFDEEKRKTSEAFSRFARFVRNVLLLHRRSTIDSFHLDIGGYKTNKSNHVDPWLIDDVQVWLKFAADREVKDLLFYCAYRDDITPPRCVFTCQSLVRLTLFGSMLVQYEHQPQLHMKALRKLTLIGVHGSNEAFNQLISACPSMQKLKLCNVEGLRDLNVTAPSAKNLDLNIVEMPDSSFTLNCPHVEILNIAVDTRCKNSGSFLLDVINVSSLQEVNVGHLPKCPSGLKTKAFLRHFRDAELFKLSSQAFKQLCRLKKVDFPQNRWQTLALQPRWDNERCLQVILELVKSSVGLEKLIIDHGVSSGSEGYNEVLGSELSTCVMPQLKNVIILGFGKCCEGQLQLIELILRNAVVLEKLEITFEENRLTAVDELDFVKQVSRLKRASANAIVDFSCN
ncbi:FBD-associated F-box protein At4g10400-like [Silene latifolia]|uniref:FBD-associated F-box protein At4g10400-like n=1 Tax=Silene latifolia TaxID=37657 RepID=UPI003D785401